MAELYYVSVLQGFVSPDLVHELRIYNVYPHFGSIRFEIGLIDYLCGHEFVGADLLGDKAIGESAPSQQSVLYVYFFGFLPSQTDNVLDYAVLLLVFFCSAVSFLRVFLTFKSEFAIGRHYCLLAFRNGKTNFSILFNN